MFKFLKINQDKSILFVALVFAVLFLVSTFFFDDTEQLEKLDQMEKELTAQMEDLKKLGELIDSTLNTNRERMDSILEANELLQNTTEQYKELFIQLEHRISSLQDVLNNADSNSSSLTTAQAQVADIHQSLKRINETETTDIAE